MNFLSIMSEGSQKITHGMQSHEVLVLTHEGNVRALTFAPMRYTPHFTRMVLHKRTVKSLPGLLMSREYLSACTIYWTALQIHMWLCQRKRKPFEQLRSTSSPCLCGCSIWKMIMWKWTTIQNSRSILKSKHTVNISLQRQFVKTQGRYYLKFTISL